jgi:hypothetical protein
MMEEYASIMKNDVWEVVPRPEDKRVVGSKWIYKVKHAADGSMDKYKARFVAKRFSQREGVDYKETFAPVAGILQSEQSFHRQQRRASASIRWMRRSPSSMELLRRRYMLNSLRDLRLAVERRMCAD